MKHPFKNQMGFTLLELILAMSIVAIIVALGLGGVRLGISARDVGEQKVETYQPVIAAPSAKVMVPAHSVLVWLVSGRV